MEYINGTVLLEITMFIRRLMLYIVMLCAAFFLYSCSAPEDSNHPLLVKARNCVSQKRYSEAAKYYEIYLNKYPASQKAHIEAAALYDENLKDPLMAIYHYRECLKNELAQQDVDNLTKWLEASEKRYYARLKRRFEDGEAAPVYKSALAKAKEEKAEAVAAQVSAPSGSKTDDNEAAAKKKPPQKIRYYTVKENDSLQRISAEVYGSSKHYKYILSSNQDILPSEKRLSIGQKLRILPLPENERK